MENQNSKSMDHYFGKAKQLPLAVEFAQIQKLVVAKGVTSPPKKSWWNLNNLIIMTTATILTTALIYLGMASYSPTELTYIPLEHLFETKNYAELEIEQSLLLEAKVDSEEAKIDKQIQSLKQGEILLIDTIFSGLTAVPIANLESVSSESIELTTAELVTLIPALEQLPEEPFVEDGLTEQPFATEELKGEVEGETKTITKSIDAANLTTLHLDNKNGNITIETWVEQKVEVTAYFTLETKEEEEEDGKKGRDDFQLNITPQGSKALIKTNWDKLYNCSCNSDTTSPKKGLLKYLYFSSNNKAETDDGEFFKYKKFKIEYLVKIPTNFNVEVSNKYADIKLAKILGDANVNLFQGNLRANDVANLELKLKYGSAFLGNMNDADVYLFQGDAEFGNSNRMDLTAKYSKLKMGGAKQLNLSGFQSDLTASEDVKEIEGDWKYGEIELLKNTERIELVAFRGKLYFQDVNYLNLSIKYSRLEAKKIDRFEIENGFQATLKIEQVNELEGELKYSPLDIGVLGKSLDLSAFQGNINVAEVKSEFKAVKLNTKYTDIRLTFDPNSKYDLNAETAYTKFSVSAEIMNVNHQNAVNGNSNHFVGTFNKSNSKEASSVIVECFQGNITLN